jgi:hypothetical protein
LSAAVVEAARSWGGQLFVVARTKLSHYPILLSIAALSIIRVPSAGTGRRSIVSALIEPALHF